MMTLKNIKRVISSLFIVLLCILSSVFGSSALKVNAASVEPSIEVNFTKGIAYNGLINKGVVYDAESKSAVFDGNSYMYFQPDVSDKFSGSFTVIVGAYLKAQDTSGYIFNTGYYDNSVALELNFKHLNFYFGNAQNLRFSLQNILTNEETFYLISLGYDANEKVLFYKVQTGTDVEDIKGGTANTIEDVAFSHVEYCLTLGAQSNHGVDVISYSKCKLNTFQIHNTYLNDSTYLNSQFNIYGGVDEVIDTPVVPDEETSNPVIPDEETSKPDVSVDESVEQKSVVDMLGLSSTTLFVLAGSFTFITLLFSFITSKAYNKGVIIILWLVDVLFTLLTVFCLLAGFGIL